MAKKRVLLTGASGSMGFSAFQELLRRRDSCDIVLLIRPSSVNKRMFAEYAGQPGLTIVWGDLINPDDVFKAVDGCDFVLHPAAMIAPAADHHPEQAWRCNVEGTRNLIAAVKRQPNQGANVRFVNVCSVAAYGDRLPPHHWIRVGDPLNPSVGDQYAVTKIIAEQAVIESGLKYWASMRQTYILIAKAWTLMDPIMFHQPPQTCIETVNELDAGYGLVQAIDAPDEFYGRVYNMGGGPSSRVMFTEYMERLFPVFGLGDYRKVMARNWFAIRNFHCGFFADSEVLNKYLGHWRYSLEDHYRQVGEAIPKAMKFGSRLAPAFATKMYLKRMCDPLKWLAENDTDRLQAFFGGREAWEKIGGWNSFNPGPVAFEPPPPEPAPRDAQDLAERRGGRCLTAETGNPHEKLHWRCGYEHEWEMTANSVRAGHWCPTCSPTPWDRDTAAKRDPALAKIYYANHAPDEQQKIEGFRITEK